MTESTNTAQPDMAQPDTGQSDTGQSDTAQSTTNTAQPDTAQFYTARPNTGEPSTVKVEILTRLPRFFDPHTTLTELVARVKTPDLGPNDSLFALAVLCAFTAADGLSDEIRPFLEIRGVATEPPAALPSSSDGVQASSTDGVQASDLNEPGPWSYFRFDLSDVWFVERDWCIEVEITQLRRGPGDDELSEMFIVGNRMIAFTHRCRLRRLAMARARDLFEPTIHDEYGY